MHARMLSLTFLVLSPPLAESVISPGDDHAVRSVLRSWWTLSIEIESS